MPNQVVSAFNLEFSGDQTLGSTGTEQRIYQEYDCCVPWDIMPGSMILAGLAGKWTAGAHDVTVRVRVGDGSSIVGGSDYLMGGTVAFERIIPAGTTVEFGELAASPVARPSGNRAFAKIVVSALSAASSSLSWSCATASILPADGFGQGLYLHSHGIDASSVGGGSTETLGHEWAVDFDQFENVTNLLFGFAAQLDSNAGGTFRIRVGGTVGAGPGSLSPDGTAVVTWINTGGPNPQAGARQMGGVIQSVAKAGLTGKQPVKITAQSYPGATRVALAIQEEH
jgi:hypothetical protein